MVHTKSDRYELYSAIKRIKNGEDKQSVFEGFKEKIDPQLLARQIAIIPDKDLSRKYNNINKILLILLSSLLLIAGIIFVFNFGVFKKSFLLWIACGFLMSIMQIYLISQKNVQIYRLLPLLLTPFIVLNVLNINNELFQSSIYSLYVLISIITNTLVVGLCIILGIKMFPYYGLFKPKKNEHGEFMYTCCK